MTTDTPKYAPTPPPARAASHDITLYRLTSILDADCADVLLQFSAAHSLTDLPLPEPEMEEWAPPTDRAGEARRPPGMFFKKLAETNKAVRLALKTDGATDRASFRVFVILTRNDGGVYYGDVTELMRYVGKNGAV